MLDDHLPPMIDTRPWILADGGALDVDRCPDCWERRAHIERYKWACKVCTGMRVLDYGCGVGYGSEMLARAGNLVTGIDRDGRAVSIAMYRRSYDFDPDRLDFSRSGGLPLLRTFDACVAFEVLEHLDSPAEFIRTVPARHLVVSVPIRPTMEANPHHKHDFTIESFEALLEGRFNIVSKWRQLEPMRWEPCIGVWHAEESAEFARAARPGER